MYGATMDSHAHLYNAFFKAQDRFQDYSSPHGFEPDVIHEYLHWGVLLAASHEHGAEQENALLCELFLRQLYHHFLEAIADPRRSRIFRRVCLDSIHVPLLTLKRYYDQFEDGDIRFLALQQQLRGVQAPLD